jgi:hypothetical protein
MAKDKVYVKRELGYHFPNHNGDRFLSTDLGLKEFNVKNNKEKIGRYRQNV